LTGVTANFFTVSGATATNSADSGVITVVFPATDTLVTTAAIGGVTPPAAGQTPVTAVTETTQYTGTVVWSPNDDLFDYTTTYTATVTLTPKTGYTLTGVTANFFTVSGATATNSADSGTVTAVFPVTSNAAGGGGGGGGGSSVANAGLSASDAAFDKNANSSAYGDVAVTLVPGGYTLSAVKYSAVTLTEDTDYTVSGSNIYTFKKEYLSTLNAGDHTFIFDMSGGTDPTFTVTIADTSYPPSESFFEDVFQSDWYYNDVKYVYENGVMNGTDAGSMLFSPGEPMTRAMLVTVLFRLDRPSGEWTAADFTDVSRNAWYADAAAWAAANGIAAGYGNGAFGPDDFVTREQTAAIFARYLTYCGGVNVTEQFIIFSDENLISDYAKEPMQILYKLGIIQGVGDKQVNPRGSSTRAETAAMLRRLIENVKNR
jgi:hypothetical protein